MLTREEIYRHRFFFLTLRSYFGCVALFNPGSYLKGYGLSWRYIVWAVNLSQLLGLKKPGTCVPDVETMCRAGEDGLNLQIKNIFLVETFQRGSNSVTLFLCHLQNFFGDMLLVSKCGVLCWRTFWNTTERRYKSMKMLQSVFIVEAQFLY